MKVDTFWLIRTRTDILRHLSLIYLDTFRQRALGALLKSDEQHKLNIFVRANLLAKVLVNMLLELIGPSGCISGISGNSGNFCVSRAPGLAEHSASVDLLAGNRSFL